MAFWRASEAAFGAELARMVEIGTLATRRGCGGRGYARTLVNRVTARVRYHYSLHFTLDAPQM